MIRVYEAESVLPLIREFYEKAWRRTTDTRRIFENIGLELTKSAFFHVPLLQSIEKKDIDEVYIGPIARAGCGLYRPTTAQLLKRKLRDASISIRSFGIGLSRSKDPLNSPAKVYWNTLRDQKETDLSSSLVILYEMGEATGSTIEGAIGELGKFNIDPKNIIILLGAACLDQTKRRLEPISSDIIMVVGSRWRYDEKPGPTQFYLTRLFDDGWMDFPPRDWGRCVSHMIDESSVRDFIDWIGETIRVSETDKELLLEEWSSKIKEKIIENPVFDIFMRAAIDEARKSLNEGGVPIGSVLVKNGKILGRGYNRRVQQNNPILHAEIDCLRDAGRLRTYEDTVLYSTLMPCYLCAGAAVQFGIKRIIVGEKMTFEGAEDFMKSKGIQVIDLNLPECKKMMKEFISKKSKIWREDIGES